jgi:hypothetical protein
MTTLDALQQLRDYCENKKSKTEHLCESATKSFVDCWQERGRAHAYYDVVSKLDSMILIEKK